MEDMVKDKTKNVAVNIRKLRQHREYSQEYVARKINVSQNSYSKLELGAVKLTIDRLFGIAEVLEIDPLALLVLKPSEVIRSAIPE